MSKILTVIRKEYLERVRSKAFVVGTVLGPLMMGLILLAPLLSELTGSQRRTVAVLDLSGAVFEPLVAALAQNAQDHVRLQAIACDGDDSACLEILKATILGQGVDAGLVVPADFYEQPLVTFYSTAVSATVLRDESLRPALNQILRDERFRRAGVPAEQHAYVLARTEWSSLQISAAAETPQSAEVGLMGGIFLVLIIYMMVLIYGQQNLTVVIEEKTSRMAEVLLASLRPEQLMLGKVLGIGLAAFTQIAVWAVAGIVISAQGVAVAGTEINLGVFGPWIWLNFLVFFVLGYLLYASLYAGLGAMCNSIQDAQQFSFVLVMGMVLPMVLMSVVIRAPDAPLTAVLSLVPFCTPVLMFMRVCMSNPPVWQVALGWLLLVATIWWANHAGGRLFRAGILLYGSAPTWGSLARALRG